MKVSNLLPLYFKGVIWLEAGELVNIIQYLGPQEIVERNHPVLSERLLAHYQGEEEYPDNDPLIERSRLELGEDFKLDDATALKQCIEPDLMVLFEYTAQHSRLFRFSDQLS